MNYNNNNVESELRWSVEQQICEDIYKYLDRANLLISDGNILDSIIWLERASDQIYIRLNKKKDTESINELEEYFKNVYIMVDELNNIQSIKNKNMMINKYNKQMFDIKLYMNNLVRVVVNYLDKVGLGLKDKIKDDPHSALQNG